MCTDGKEVASRTSDVAGDGTTTATILAQAIYREGVKLLAAGGNPMSIKLESITLKDLGTAKRITIDKDNTTIIVDGGGDRQAIQSRIKKVKIDA